MKKATDALKVEWDAEILSMRDDIKELEALTNSNKKRADALNEQKKLLDDTSEDTVVYVADEIHNRSTPGRYHTKMGCKGANNKTTLAKAKDDCRELCQHCRAASHAS